MNSILEIRQVVAGLIGGIIALLLQGFARRRTRFLTGTTEGGETPTDAARIPPTPYDPADYKEVRKSLVESYRGSIQSYDKLITWSGGGALVLSVTLLDTIAQTPQQQTKWLIATSWSFLLLSVLSSLGSQYTSSRLFSWRLNRLDHIQEQPEPSDDGFKQWWNRYNALERRTRTWGIVTSILNFSAGVLLVVGLGCLAAFAFLNTTFS